MKPVYEFLDACRDAVRAVMRDVAKLLNSVSGGGLSANSVTFIGLAMHIPIALLIAEGYLGYSAILLVVFGLFDTLDGELARLQGKASNRGMLLDAVTDRIKEVILYMGIVYFFSWQDASSGFMAIIVAALGGSLLVSYVKAKGETAVAGGNLTANEVNRLFQDGLMRYEIRMFALVIGLLIGIDGLGIAVIAIAVFTWVTAFGRLNKISRRLR